MEIEEILSRSRKVSEEAEVFWVSSEETPVEFEANRLKRLETNQGTVVVLRIIKGGRIGLATTTRLDDPEELINIAVEMSQFGARASFELPSQIVYPEVQVYDPGVEAVSIEEMVGLGDSLISMVRGYNPELVCDGTVARSVSQVRIINSRGGEGSYKRSVFSIMIEGTLVRGTDMLFVGEADSSCRPIRDVGQMARSVREQLERAENLALVSTKKLPVIFTPKGVASALVMPLALAFNGKTVLEGASPLGGRQGELLFDKKLTIQDDATTPHHPQSRPYDDEGMPSQRNLLINSGVVGGFLYDLQTAGLAHTRSTGSAARLRGGIPSPSVSTITIREGDASFDDMVRDLKEGLVVEMLIGAGQGNILGGEFGGNVLLGYKVENGRIVGRVKDTMISGNVYEALRDIAAIGSEAEWVGGALKTPPIYLSSISISSKA